uniref:RNA-directed DNA polymerase n=1 Tax=Plectus sambesii TaxID=2011161 RepID=A0A914UH49_9BILA
MTSKQLSGRLARWQLLLSEFNLTITVRPGTKHKNADFLSRLHEDETEGDEDRPPAPGVGEKLGTVLLTQTANAVSLSNDGDASPVTDEILVRPALPEQRDDTFFGPIIAYLEDGTLPDEPTTAKRVVAEASQFVIESDALYFVDHKRKGRRRLALPKSMRQDAVLQEHSGVFGGHLGHERVYYAVAQIYYWPGMYADAKRWIRGCLTCAVSRDHRKHRPPLVSMQTEGIFDLVSVDVLEMPLTRQGNKYIISFVDCFSKFCESFATANQTAETIAKLLVEQIVCRHGCPSKLLSDRGPAFMSDLLGAVLKHLGVQKLNTSGYHPQGNGEVERMNRTLIKMLKRSANSPDEWDRRLPFTVFAYNSTPAKSHGFPPLFLCYGRMVCRPSTLDFGPAATSQAISIDDYRHELVRNLTVTNDLVTERIRKAQERQKCYYDQQQPASKFVVGQRVLVHMPAEMTNKLRKMNLPDHGPFYIRQLTSTNAEVELITDQEYRIFVALDRLRACPPEVPYDQSYTGRRKRRRRRRRLQPRTVAAAPADMTQPVVSSLDVSSEPALRSSSYSEPASHCLDLPTVRKRGRPRGSKRKMPVSDQPVRQRHPGLRARPKQQPVAPGFVRW